MGLHPAHKYGSREHSYDVAFVLRNCYDVNLCYDRLLLLVCRKASATVLLPLCTALHLGSLCANAAKPHPCSKQAWLE